MQGNNAQSIQINSVGQMAVIDLGSNSFQMLLVEVLGGRIVEIARFREKIQLAAGLDAGLFHFEEAARLTGRKLNKAARHGLMQSRDTVELIAEGSRDTVADSGRAVSWLARELKDLVREGHIGVGAGFEETDLAPSLIK